MGVLSTISLAEYNTTVFRPDVEFLDGVLREKPLPSKLHGFVQLQLGIWFYIHKKEWGVFALSEVRTQVDASRVRLPDVAVTSGITLDNTSLDQPPLIAIEILSEEDRVKDLQGRARDLHRMGVRNIWLIDPMERSVYIWDEAAMPAWLPTDRLQVKNSPIHVDLPWLWAEIDAVRQS